MYFADDRELEAVRRVFERRRLFRYQADGPGECDLFEREFSGVLGSPHALMVTSGTNALIAALTAAGVGPGDEVLVPSYTFVATANAVTHVGAVPVIVNIDESLGLDVEDAARCLSPKTRAVIPVHMDGLSADMTAICSFARRHGIVVIEDAAQALGGSHRGRRLGAIGDFGCFSLNENKIISCGEGGILTTASRDWYERAFSFHDGSAQFHPAMAPVFTKITPFLGSSMRVSEISGAIMRVQLGRLEAILSGLRARKKLWTGPLEGVKNAKIIRGSCPDGDCATSLHLSFSDPMAAGAMLQRFRAEGLPFSPVTARPAHASWKWSFLLGDRAAATAARNPFASPEARRTFENARVLPSIEILTRVLKMDIDLATDTGATRHAADKLARLLDRT